MNNKYQIKYVPIKDLIPADYNPRKWSSKRLSDLRESISKFGIVVPGVINCAPNRKNIIIGSHMRVAVAKELGIKEFPVVYVNIPDTKKEKELNLRLNKNTGEFDYDLLAKFDEPVLVNVGFESEDLDEIFHRAETNIEQFDVNKELKRLKIDKINIEPGDYYILGSNKLLCAKENGCTKKV